MKVISSHLLNKEQLEQVWARAKAEDDYDPAVYRKDVFGSWICRDEFCNRRSNLGWVIGSAALYATPSAAATPKVETQPKPGDVPGVPIQWLNYEKILKGEPLR